MIIAADVTGSGIRETFASGENVLADIIEVMLNIIGFVILTAAGFLIFNAFAMAVTQRRRQIGALRSLGMTRGQVLRLVLVEALTTGGAGILLGLLLGPLFGSGLLNLMQLVGVEIGQGSVSLGSVALAVVVGITITLVSVLLPARRATRVSPLAALRGEAASGVARAPLRWVALGTATILALAAYLVIAPPGEWSGYHPPWDFLMPFLLAMPWLGALGMLLPAFVGAAGKAARGAFTRLWGATGRMSAKITWWWFPKSVRRCPASPRFLRT